MGVLLARWNPVVTLYATSFNIEGSNVLTTQCIYVFCTDLRTNSYYFPIQHLLIDFFVTEKESVYCAVRI
jgi:hypothetical protein